jgi:hypothetical protein
VTDSLLAHLNTRNNQIWQIKEPVTLRHMPWSTLYFIELQNKDTHRQVVSKIVHFPNQTRPSISWESEELLLRGQREYTSLALVHDHFQHKSAEGLYTVPPIAYLPDINAVVMEFVAGHPLYDACLTPSRILRSRGLKQATNMLFKSGQWLRWLHQLPVDKVLIGQTFTAEDNLNTLLNETQRLKELQINIDAFPGWQQAIDLLQRVKGTEPTSCHGDFHLRNLFVLPDGGLSGIDIALERVESPYFDIGKLIADLKTRKLRILMGGLLPNDKAINSLTTSFLNGYFQGDVINKRELLLFEGRFLLQKWRESLEAKHSIPSFVPHQIGSAGFSLLVNPTFKHILRSWLTDILEV